MKYVKILGIFWFGVTLGFCGCLLILALFAKAYEYPSFVQNYQSLIGGVLAFAGAWLAWYSLEKQNQFQKEIYDQQRHTIEIASRASLTFLLSEVLAYTVECSNYLRCRYNAGENIKLFNDLSNGKYSFSAPSCGGEIVSGLLEVVKSTSGHSQIALASLLKLIQINDARLQAFDNLVKKNGWGRLRVLEYIGHSVDVAELQTRAVKLFPFSRLEIDEVDLRVLANEVRGQYQQLDFGDIEDDLQLKKMLEARLINRYE